MANISELGDFAFSRNGLTNAFYIGALSKFMGSNRFLDKRSMNYVEGKAFRFSKRTSLAMSSGSKFVEIVLSTPIEAGPWWWCRGRVLA